MPTKSKTKSDRIEAQPLTPTKMPEYHYQSSGRNSASSDENENAKRDETLDLSEVTLNLC